MPVLYRVHLIDNPSELVNIRWNEEGQITQIEPYQQMPGNVPSLWDKDRDQGMWDGEGGLVRTRRNWRVFPSRWSIRAIPPAPAPNVD
ncbi:hypothetical protein [Sulfobacillus thermosulfidooxidans]|uniref:hypothetical protein n=1 Tax=Sulfobacillus thermosulfidooxidans TaxID=28034 RepID=UPI0015942F27|nr:hypothetical protein [Sulfobacillus thermosulfidooxidans]